MQVDSPHKFWYKYCEDPIQDRLIDELECEIASYAADLLIRDDQLPTLNDGDVRISSYFFPSKQTFDLANFRLFFCLTGSCCTSSALE